MKDNNHPAQPELAPEVRCDAITGNRTEIFFLQVFFFHRFESVYVSFK